MKYVEEKRFLQTNAEGQNFKIKASQKAFQVLSTNLYKNPVRAIVRELTCNAIDAVKDGGRVFVRFPTEIAPEFHIWDTGIGMTTEEMETVYTTFFDSTKTDTNDLIGAFGLGSKTPLAITDQFTVNTSKNGISTYAIIYLDDRKIPTFMITGTEECDPSIHGTSIKFAVKENDILTFYREAVKVFLTTSITPVIERGLEEFLRFANNGYFSIKSIEDYEKYKIHISKNPTILCSELRHDSIAIMGGIPYPIRLNEVLSNSYDLQSSIERSYPVLNFEIGELEISPSREELFYDKRTINTIRTHIFDKIKESLKELSESKLSKIDWIRKYLSLPSFIRDDHRYDEIQDFLNEIDELYGKDFKKKYNNMLSHLKDVVSFEVANRKLNPISYSINLNRQEINNFRDSKLMSNLMSNKPVVVAVLNKERTDYINNINQGRYWFCIKIKKFCDFVNDHPNTDVIFVPDTSKSSLEKFGVQVIDFESYVPKNPIKRESADKRKERAKIESMCTVLYSKKDYRNSNMSSYIKISELKDDNILFLIHTPLSSYEKKYVFIKDFDNYNVCECDYMRENDTIRTLNIIEKWGLLKDKIVIGISAAEFRSAKLKDDDRFKCFWKYVHEVFNESFKDSIKERLIDTNFINNRSHNVPSIYYNANPLEEKTSIFWKTFKQFKKVLNRDSEYKKPKYGYYSVSNMMGLSQRLSKLYGTEPIDYDEKTSLVKHIEEVNNKYPLLVYLSQSAPKDEVFKYVDLIDRG